MYPTSSNIPAPYELNNQGSGPYGGNYMPTALAHGGRPKHRKMVIAHFNPQELDALDHLQGQQERCPKTGLRSYSHLEELFKNPHIVENIHKHAQAEHHAYGGAALEHLAEGGRRGDSEIALIGPHTHNLFDRLAGHRTQNPYTGHPEYWSLGGALKGAWNTVKGTAQKVIPTALNVADKALPMAWNVGKGMLPQPLQNVGQGALDAYQSWRGGQSPTQALGKGIQTVGSGLGRSGIGAALQGAGSTLNQGQGVGSALSRGAQQGFNMMGGGQGVMNSAQNILGGMGTPGGMRGAASNVIQDYRKKFLPQSPQAPQGTPGAVANQDTEQYPEWLQNMNA